MKVLYLTTSVSAPTFAAKTEGIVSKPNPAGQNFHETLIRCFGEMGDVLVISFPPTSLGMKSDTEEVSSKIKYRYVRLAKNKVIRHFICPHKAKKAIGKATKNFYPDLVVFDSLNWLCANLAVKLARGLRRSSIAVLTDAPRNITGVSSSFCEKIISIVSKASASYALTEGLVKEFQLSDKPHYVNPILADEEEVEAVKSPRPFIYYGGALFVKDGLEELLNAYTELNPDYDLVISGHGHYGETIKAAAQNNPHIIYLGQVDKKTHRSYIKGSLLAINPRPYRESLDDVAVPSKLIEYLLYASRIASRPTKAIQNAYPADINWIEGDIKEYLATHISKEGKPVDLKENKAAKTLIENYGISKISQLLRGFLIKKELFL